MIDRWTITDENGAMFTYTAAGPQDACDQHYRLDVDGEQPFVTAVIRADARSVLLPDPDTALEALDAYVSFELNGDPEAGGDPELGIRLSGIVCALLDAMGLNASQARIDAWSDQ